MNKSSKLAFTPLFTLIIFLTALLAYLLLPPQVPYSPLSLTTPTLIDSAPEELFIYGFLPFWNLKKVQPEALSTVTHLSYFTLHLNSSGQLVKLESKTSEDPGFTNYKRLLSLRENSTSPYPSLILTFMPYDQDALSGLLNNASAQENAISTIKSLLQESSAVGLNIDFEPTGSVSPSLRNNFTSFVKDLRQSLCPSSSPTCPLLSVSIYPSAASRPRLWDLTNLSPHLDHLVVMTYDYHLPGGLKAGPNSPLRGAGELFEHDILTNLAEITDLVPSSQILLGIPFYGYEWSTDTNAKYSPSEERGTVASLERIETLIKEDTLELLWDRNSLTPYAIRRSEDKIISQIYYESVDSIRLKLELVRSAGLGGIAIWALGYEGHNPALWQTISTLNNQ